MDTPEEEMWRTNRKGRAEPGSDRTCTEKGSLGLSLVRRQPQGGFKDKAKHKDSTKAQRGTQYLPFKHSYYKNSTTFFVKKMLRELFDFTLPVR